MLGVCILTLVGLFHYHSQAFQVSFLHCSGVLVPGPLNVDRFCSQAGETHCRIAAVNSVPHVIILQRLLICTVIAFVYIYIGGELRQYRGNVGSYLATVFDFCQPYLHALGQALRRGGVVACISAQFFECIQYLRRWFSQCMHACEGHGKGHFPIQSASSPGALCLVVNVTRDTGGFSFCSVFLIIR